MPKPQYGARHQRERRRWQAVIDRGDAACCLCGIPITPGAAWDLDHLPGTNEYRGAACQSCNRSEGAARGNRARAPQVTRRWVL